jgi:hypothetical protein
VARSQDLSRSIYIRELDAAIGFNEVVACNVFFASEHNYRHAVVGPGGGNVWKIYFNPKWAKVGWVYVKPTAAIAQIVRGTRALVWTELATDRSKHGSLTLRGVEKITKA